MSSSIAIQELLSANVNLRDLIWNQMQNRYMDAMTLTQNIPRRKSRKQRKNIRFLKKEVAVMIPLG